MKQRNNTITILKRTKMFLFAILSLIVPLNAQAQLVAVKGSVSTSAGKVRYAAVTFIDNSDTTRKTAVLTDPSGNYSMNLVTSVPSAAAQPSGFALDQNYPNPFSSSTAIPYRLEKPAEVTVTIYDILGREVRRFSMGMLSIGAHGTVWDGKNNHGELVSRGTYFYRLQANGEMQVRKMLYRFGGNNVVVSPLGIFAPKITETSVGTSAGLLAGNYSVRVENTDSTFPAIAAQRFDNIIAQSTTSIDFSVSTDSVFSDVTTGFIYPDSLQQLIRGFGAANILRWRPDMTPAQVQKAFGTGPGELGFTMLRLRVPYEASDAEFAYQVPTAKLAESMGAIVFATPWTPPPAMKSNNNAVGGTLNESSYGAYAAYLKRFGDYMAANGAPLYAISLQNEPDAVVTYESCTWNGTQFLNFCKNNAASIGMKIIMPESENFKHTLSDPTLNDSAACANVAIVAGHLYGGGLTTYPLAVSKGKEFWMTEYLDTDTSWTAVLNTGKQINDCMKVGMNAYVTWYIVRFYGPIDENGNVTKRGIVMSQFAKFIRPGFTRVASTDHSSRSLIDVTAYANGRKLVIVAINRGTTAASQPIVLWNGTVGSFIPYVTSATKSCVQQSSVAFKNGSFNYSLEPMSITTFVLN
jgi:glucuronoarabinoxylan endo-1,4-beta-xylanase